MLANWEQIKRAEKARTSVFDGVPSSLPALAYADAMQRKAAKVGFDWPDVHGRVAEDRRGGDRARRRGGRRLGNDAIADELGDLLFAVVNVARHLDVEPEVALRAATHKFRSRGSSRSKQLAAARGIDMHAADLETLDSTVERGQGRRRWCLAPSLNAPNTSPRRVPGIGSGRGSVPGTRVRDEIGRGARACQAPGCQRERTACASSDSPKRWRSW